jgi:hypothetical protein
MVNLKILVRDCSKLKFKVLCDVAACSLVGVDRCFRGVYCVHHLGDDGGSTHL